jgi:calcineurin-like phosphoesterase family protein
MSEPAIAVPLLEPENILRLEAAEADQLLDRLEALVPIHPAVVDIAGGPGQSAIVFGDTHGDWRSARTASDRFLASPAEQCLVGLGDYVDRAPPDCGEGSVANALYLLGLVARFPSRVYLLQGNHEATRVIPVLPHDLPEEVDQLWGPDPARYSRILGLLERGPIAARTSSGVFLAHAGFPAIAVQSDWRASFEGRSFELLADVLWRECAASRIQRGLAPPFTERDLSQFLRTVDCRVFLRGHDPDLVGRSVFHESCLTIHTTRVYERFGGVIIVRVPLDSPAASTRSLRVEHLETEGRRFVADP